MAAHSRCCSFVGINLLGSKKTETKENSDGSTMDETDDSRSKYSPMLFYSNIMLMSYLVTNIDIRQGK